MKKMKLPIDNQQEMEGIVEKSGPKIDLSIDLDATPQAVWEALTTAHGIKNWFSLDAKVDNPGRDGRVWFSFGEGMAWESRIGAWDPPNHVSWVDESEIDGKKLSLVVDFHVSGRKGQTTVRLVHSGFGNATSWDEEIEGLKGGWGYFMFHLKHYLEHHLGTRREVVTARVRLEGRREDAWSRVLSTQNPVIAEVPQELTLGSEWAVDLGGEDIYLAVLRSHVPGRTVGLEIPDLNAALLLIELEPGAADTHCGYWLSLVNVDDVETIRTNFLSRINALH